MSDGASYKPNTSQLERGHAPLTPCFVRFLMDRLCRESAAGSNKAWFSFGPGRLGFVSSSPFYRAPSAYRYTNLYVHHYCTTRRLCQLEYIMLKLCSTVNCLVHLSILRCAAFYVLSLGFGLCYRWCLVNRLF